jgi:hypothetical protein
MMLLLYVLASIGHPQGGHLFKIQCYILSRNVKIPVIILHFKHFCNILTDNILF